MSLRFCREKRKRTSDKGFTVVELLIATTVFSIVLLLVSTAMVQIANVYYKGVTETGTQNIARGVIDAIAQGVQFNGGIVTQTPASAPSPGTSTAFCIGETQYAYQLGWELTDTSPQATQNQAYHVLAQSHVPNCAAAGGVAAGYLDQPTVNGVELMNQHMRLAKLSLQQIGTTNLYRIDVRVVYGDNDVLTNPTAANAACAGISAGSQYCAVSELSTIVSKRVQ